MSSFCIANKNWELPYRLLQCRSMNPLQALPMDLWELERALQWLFASCGGDSMMPYLVQMRLNGRPATSQALVIFERGRILCYQRQHTLRQRGIL